MYRYDLFTHRIGLVGIGRVGSVGVTVSISIERYLSICHQNNERKSLLVIIPTLFAILYNIPRFFELLACTESQMNAQIWNNSSITYNSENTTSENGQDATNSSIVEVECTPEGLRGTPMRQNRWYIIFYSVVSKLLLVEIIPWITVIVLNYLIWKKIQEFQANRQRVMGKQSKQGK